MQRVCSKICYLDVIILYNITNAKLVEICRQAKISFWGQVSRRNFFRFGDRSQIKIIFLHLKDGQTRPVPSLQFFARKDVSLFCKVSFFLKNYC